VKIAFWKQAVRDCEAAVEEYNLKAQKARNRRQASSLRSALTAPKPPLNRYYARSYAEDRLSLLGPQRTPVAARIAADRDIDFVLQEVADRLGSRSAHAEHLQNR
jgi:hypothetical protein